MSFKLQLKDAMRARASAAAYSALCRRRAPFRKKLSFLRMLRKKRATEKEIENEKNVAT